jgi:hypothetical protein
MRSCLVNAQRTVAGVWVVSLKESDDGKTGRNGMVRGKRAAGGTSEIALAHARRLPKTGTFSVLLMTTTTTVCTQPT